MVPDRVNIKTHSANNFSKVWLYGIFARDIVRLTISLIYFFVLVVFPSKTSQNKQRSTILSNCRLQIYVVAKTALRSEWRNFPKDVEANYSHNINNRLFLSCFSCFIYLFCPKHVFLTSSLKTC